MRERTNCFLIDNDPEDQEIFCLALEEITASVHCRTAGSGPEALKLLNGEPAYTPDFIFIDMNMPLMDGRECLTEVKKLSWLNEVPVYMYSTDANPRIVGEMKELGAKDLLIKPGSFKLLKEMLARLLNNENQ
ncbi:MAG: response regulator [Flavisolibacter sp.]